MNRDIRTLVVDVLGRGYLMSLGTLDDGGVWVADVIYVFNEDLSIYWMSDSATRHSKAIVTHPRVAGTITVSGKGENNLGIQLEGVAQKIDGARYDLARKHYAKRNKPEPAESLDVLDGDSWYMLKPTKIELICEEHFGFKKQTIELL